MVIVIAVAPVHAEEKQGDYGNSSGCIDGRRLLFWRWHLFGAHKTIFRVNLGDLSVARLNRAH